jgi:hypothetical protein
VRKAANRQGNNPGLSGVVLSVKVGNRVGKTFEGKNKGLVFSLTP